MKALAMWLALMAGVCLTFGQEEGEAPEITSDSPDVVGVGTKIIFTASGGKTPTPPEDMGTPPWTRTGTRFYMWSVKFTDAGQEARPHPLDGKMTTENKLEFSMDMAGNFDISVCLQEEWEDSSNPPRTIIWPELSEDPKEKKAP